MSAGNRPLPGIIPGINKIPGLEGQPFGQNPSWGGGYRMPQGMPATVGMPTNVGQNPSWGRSSNNPVASALGSPSVASSAPGAIPAGMQLVNGALEPKPQQAAQSPFNFGGIRRLWG
jgi:hypothetical protein